jgi:XTP/dITP diphosphohydrolase
VKILLASSNPHKIGEILAVWDALRDAEAPPLQRVELIGLDALDRVIAEPVEDQPTFEANALLKARHYARSAQMHCIADDSGLEVDALGGGPGVRSARYANATGPRPAIDTANNKLMLEQLGKTPIEQRTARFICAMALCGPSESSSDPVTVRGTIEGRILTLAEAGPGGRGRGENGFGYDPLFLVPRLGRTTAELSSRDKNRISHRGQAARLMWQALRSGPQQRA